jgi:hypothetical protein
MQTLPTIVSVSQMPFSLLSPLTEYPETSAFAMRAPPSVTSEVFVQLLRLTDAQMKTHTVALFLDSPTPEDVCQMRTLMTQESAFVILGSMRIQPREITGIDAGNAQFQMHLVLDQMYIRIKGCFHLT